MKEPLSTVSRSTHTRVWALAWPMILSNISQPLLGLIDTAILGHLGSARYLAAVAVGSSILAFLYWAFGFLRMGTTGLTAQALGRLDTQDVWRILGRSLVLALALGLALTLLAYPLSTLAVALMSPSETVGNLAESYCRIRMLSAPAALASYAVVGWYVGRQNTRVPLLLLVLTNSLNVLLDLLFIVVLGWQSDGAALATVVAEYCGLILAVGLLVRYARQQDLSWRTALISKLAEYSELLRVNRHLFVRTICLLFSIAFFTAQGARMGEAVVAANAILINLLFLTAFGMDGFAHAVEALVGEAVGAGQQDDFDSAVASCAQWSVVTAVLFCSVFLFGRDIIPTLFTNVDEILVQIDRYYPWLIALPLLAVASYLLDGIFIGATRTLAMRNSMLLCVLLVYLPSWYLFRGLDNHGLWLAFTLFSGARGITLGYAFFRLRRDRQWLQAEGS